MQLALGDGCTAVTTTEGELFTFGGGSYGMLGHGRQVSQHTPRKVDALEGKRMLHVAVGGDHTAVVTTEGELFTFGCGEDGQLGLGDSEEEFSDTEEEFSDLEEEFMPREVEMPDNKRVLQVAAGFDHTAVLTTEGELFTFGSWTAGQLGRDTAVSLACRPRKVEAFEGMRVLQVATGSHYTAVVTIEGKLFTFGCGEYGQLGLGDTDEQDTPREVQMPDNKRVLQVAAGGEHTAAVTAEGELFTFGHWAGGKLGHDDYKFPEKFPKNERVPRKVEAFEGERVLQAAAGGYHTAALTAEGELFTFGRGGYGQLGHGSTNDEFKPRKVDTFQGMRVVQVAVGKNHTAVVTTNGGLFTFGSGDNGELGQGSTNNVLTPCEVAAIKLA